jgi:2-haloacid dehalogenase
MKKILTFDLYGTLFDWNYSIGNFLKLFNINIHEFFKIEFEEIKNFRPYSEILKSCLNKLVKDYNEDLGDSFVLSFAKSPPFPDTLIGLKLLKKMNVKLGIISNTEKRLIKITLSGLENFFDWIITAEDTGIYKPDIGAFKKAYDIMNVNLKDVIHVSAYPNYDLATAKNLVRTVMLKRYNYSWDEEIRYLSEIIKILI